MPISAGQLTERVTLFIPDVQRGEGGSISVEMTAEITVWARVEPGGGNQAERSGGELARQSTRITIRRYPGIDPRWQVAWRDRFYEIEDVSEPEDGRNEYLVLTCYADEVASE